MNKILIAIISILLINNITQAQKDRYGVKNVIPEKPKLVIGIVVEQMRQDYMERFWDDFSSDGFKKLATNGSYCKEANLNYSLTQTAPGYATIVTGTEPSEHGIVSNYWYNPLTGIKENSILDTKHKIIGTKNAFGSYSPHNMISTTFGDEAKLSNQGRSKIISISLDAYGAILSGGFSADAAYWFDDNSGDWVTSSYYMDKLPQWVINTNRKHMPDEYLERIWLQSLPTDRYSNEVSDSILYKFGIDGIYKTFPYIYEDIRKYVHKYELVKMIPEGNTHTTDMAIAALYNEGLGKDEYTDFLFINYSVPEYVGRLFGPQSIEVQDLFIKLDKDIAHLINTLEDVIGKNNFVLYLTSNHGVAEVPQYLKDNKIPAGNYKQHYIFALLKSYLEATYGQKEWILDFSNNQIYLNKTLIEDSHLSLAEFHDKIISFIINSSGITNAISSYQFQNTNFNHGMPAKMQNSFNQKRSGDIMISLKSGWIEDVPYATDHNSGYKYDTHVPLMWYGWKINSQEIYNPINITDIAPTISIILNTPQPPMATGKGLEILLDK